jgi:hypothetical protein
MATYKVIQDIEAEDQFVGPLTLKQFIFAGAGVFFSYLGVFFASKGAAFFLVVLAPLALLGFFLAIPWSREQSTEVWILAKLRFRLKPKTRIWDQAGLEELVTITVPKKEEKVLTNGLPQEEVKSRLKALADTLDTRGWAIKHATMTDAYSTPSLLQQQPVSQRLIDPQTLPNEVPDVDLASYKDLFDEDNSVAENVDSMMQNSAQQHRQASLDMMERARRGEPISAPEPSLQFTPPVDAYNDGAFDEKAMAQQLRTNRMSREMPNSRMKQISVIPGAGSLANPYAVQGPEQTMQDNTRTVDDQSVTQAQADMTPAADPAILELAQNNDLNVATLARQANKKSSGNDEVVISLR